MNIVNATAPTPTGRADGPAKSDRVILGPDSDSVDTPVAVDARVKPIGFDDMLAQWMAGGSASDAGKPDAMARPKVDSTTGDAASSTADIASSTGDIALAPLVDGATSPRRAVGKDEPDAASADPGRAATGSDAVSNDLAAQLALVSQWAALARGSRMPDTKAAGGPDVADKLDLVPASSGRATIAEAPAIATTGADAKAVTVGVDARAMIAGADAKAPLVANAKAPIVADVEAPIVADVEAPIVADAKTPVVADAKAAIFADVTAPVVGVDAKVMTVGTDTEAPNVGVDAKALVPGLDASAPTAGANVKGSTVDVKANAPTVDADPRATIVRGDVKGATAGFNAKVATVGVDAKTKTVGTDATTPTFGPDTRETTIATTPDAPPASMADVPMVAATLVPLMTPDAGTPIRERGSRTTAAGVAALSASAKAADPTGRDAVVAAMVDGRAAKQDAASALDPTTFAATLTKTADRTLREAFGDGATTDRLVAVEATLGKVEPAGGHASSMSTLVAPVVAQASVTQPAAALPAASLREPVGTPAWSNEVGQATLRMAADDLQTASLRLNPEHLGPLDVTVRIDNGVAHLAFGAAHADTRAALEASRPALDQMFSDQGLKIGDCAVGDSSSQRRFDADASQAQTSGRDANRGTSDTSFSDDPLVPAIATRITRPLGLVDTFA